MRPFSPLFWILLSVLAGITTAIDLTNSVTGIQEHRVTGDQCTPNVSTEAYNLITRLTLVDTFLYSTKLGRLFYISDFPFSMHHSR